MMFRYMSVLLLCTKVLSGDEEQDNYKFVKRDAIVFPGLTARFHSRRNEIPLDLIRQLNDVSNVTDLFKNYIEPPDSEEIEFRFGGPNEDERTGVTSAKMAKCMPELRTVPLKDRLDMSTYHFPSCIRVERCGGCCSHPLLSCEPIEMKILQLSVIVTEYKGGSQLRYRGREMVEVEQHTKCKCDCRVRRHDCSKYQRYNQQKCRCECSNKDEEKECYKGPVRRLWNPDTCSCMCRDEFQCGSGYYFDFLSCKCAPASSKSPKYWKS